MKKIILKCLKTLGLVVGEQKSVDRVESGLVDSSGRLSEAGIEMLLKQPSAFDEVSQT